MAKYASKVVAQALAWLGYNEADGSHKKIIDVYNSQKKLPRSYPVKYTDQWCATFVSAVAVKLGYADIMPTECGCPQMITLYKNLGAWVENEAVTPAPGWILFYDWDDNGKGDNLGSPEHVGIVEKVEGNTITVIEGNYKNAVTRRNLAVNGRYIRGYGVPKYDKETATETTSKGESIVSIELSILRNGSKGEQVKALQRMLYSMGYDLGSSKVDGDFGSKTDAAVKAYQKNKGLTADGIVGQQTWNKLLRG